jgi:serine/threonine protein phosphatase PrpC
MNNQQQNPNELDQETQRADEHLATKDVPVGETAQAAPPAPTAQEGQTIPLATADDGQNGDDISLAEGEYPFPDLPKPPRLLQGLSVGSLRDIGLLRETNQDSMYALTTTLPRGTTTDLTMGLFIVADGMGGHEDGELASRIAIRTIVDHVFANFISPMLNETMAEPIQTLMESAIKKANQEIWDHAQMIGSDMGATCTAALLLGHSLSLGHVGDTRAYLLKDGQLDQITTDHSAVGRLIQLGQLEPSAARDHPLRSQLYRSIGQSPQVEVDMLYMDVTGYTHILLCSDGLWDMVLEDAMVAILQQQLCPQQLCQELIAQANTNGGEDNISAIVVTLPVHEDVISSHGNFGW